MLIQLFFLSVILAVCAFTYAEILTDDEMILFNWKGFLYRSLSGEVKWKMWLYKILVGCSYCVAGQWCLWAYLFISIFGCELFDKIVVYNPFIHIGVVLMTIFNVAIIKRLRIYGD